MPIGYLVAVMLAAVCTFAALFPPGRPPVLAALAFRLGLVVSELPQLVVPWLAASTLLAIGQGDAASAGGRVCVGLAVVTTAGLVVITRRGLRAGAAVDGALVQGLGPIPPAHGNRTRPPSARDGLRYARILLAPLWTRTPKVRRVANVRYGDAGGRNLLDVYHHRSRPAGGPVLVHLHGGHYRHGRKSSQSLPMIYRLARRGWVCVSANYRLRPAAQHPDHLIDLKKVIAWVREHGREYGADPATVFVSGSSAGAHLAALAALTPGDPAFQPGFEDADTSVTAAICLGGYYGRYFGQGSSSSPVSRVRADAPPFFIAHGDRDTVVPVEGARHFVAALRGASARPVVYAELPGAQHAFDLFTSFRFETLINGIELFAARVRPVRPVARPGDG